MLTARSRGRALISKRVRTTAGGGFLILLKEFLWACFQGSCLAAEVASGADFGVLHEQINK